jgi:hypothetical protein
MSKERARMLVVDPDMDLDDLFDNSGFNSTWIDISVKQSIDKLAGGDGFLAALNPNPHCLLATTKAAAREFKHPPPLG